MSRVWSLVSDSRGVRSVIWLLLIFKDVSLVHLLRRSMLVRLLLDMSRIWRLGIRLMEDMSVRSLKEM